MATAIKREPAAERATPDELPEGWARQPIHHVFESFGGGTPSRANAAYWGGTVPWLSSGDIKGDQIQTATEFITKAALENSSANICRAGSVVVVVRSGILAHTLPVAVLGCRAAINQDIKCFDCGNDQVNSWLALALRASAKDILALNREGTTVQSVKYDTLKDFELPVPPLTEQRRIVAKVNELLEHVNASREHLTKIPKILKAFRQSILAAACSGRLTEDWRKAHGCPAWSNVTVKDVIVDKPRNGLSIKAADYETPVRSLTLTATTSGLFDGRHFKYLDVEIAPESHLWLRRGDILLQRGNTDEYVGIAALYDGEDNAYIYPDLMIKIRPGPKVISEFLWIALSEPQARQYFRENASGSQGSMPKINQAVVQQAVIPLPSRDEQREIFRRVEILFKLADKVEKRGEAATKRTDRLTQAVLAKAFRGELVPTEAELARREGRDYQPASVLLERIKAQPNIAVASKNGHKRRT